MLRNANTGSRNGLREGQREQTVPSDCSHSWLLLQSSSPSTKESAHPAWGNSFNMLIFASPWGWLCFRDLSTCRLMISKWKGIFNIYLWTWGHPSFESLGDLLTNHWWSFSTDLTMSMQASAGGAQIEKLKHVNALKEVDQWRYFR